MVIIVVHFSPTQIALTGLSGMAEPTTFARSAAIVLGRSSVVEREVRRAGSSIPLLLYRTITRHFEDCSGYTGSGHGFGPVMSAYYPTFRNENASLLVS